MDHASSDIWQPPAQDTSGGGGQWMLTFADLLSLMLTFYVLLYSMSSVEPKQWESLKDSLSQRLRPQIEEPESPMIAEKTSPLTKLPAGMELGYLYSLLRQQVRAQPALKDIRVEWRGEAIALMLPNEAMFVTGSARIRETARQTLILLVDLLYRLPNQIRVHSHTLPGKDAPDAVPENNASHTAPMLLSLSRAMTLAYTINQAGYARPINAFGLGDLHARASGQEVGNGDVSEIWIMTTR